MRREGFRPSHSACFVAVPHAKVLLTPSSTLVHRLQFARFGAAWSSPLLSCTLALSFGRHMSTASCKQQTAFACVVARFGALAHTFRRAPGSDFRGRSCQWTLRDLSTACVLGLSLGAPVLRRSFAFPMQCRLWPRLLACAEPLREAQQWRRALDIIAGMPPLQLQPNAVLYNVRARGEDEGNEEGGPSML